MRVPERFWFAEAVSSQKNVAKIPGSWEKATDSFFLSPPWDPSPVTLGHNNVVIFSISSSSSSSSPSSRLLLLLPVPSSSFHLPPLPVLPSPPSPHLPLTLSLAGLPACSETVAASPLQAATGRAQDQGRDRGKRPPVRQAAARGQHEGRHVTGASDRHSFQSPGVSIHNRLPGPGGRCGEEGEGGVIWVWMGRDELGVGERLVGTHTCSQPGARVGGGEGMEPTGCREFLPPWFLSLLPPSYLNILFARTFPSISSLKPLWEGRQNQLFHWKRRKGCFLGDGGERNCGGCW